MSLVSCITNFGMALLVGDLTISGIEPDKELFIPTINKVATDFDKEKTRPVSFAKKTIIIKDKLAVGCTGNVQSIETLFKHVRDFFLYREITEEHLVEFYTEVKANHDYNKISAIFLLIRDENFPYGLKIDRLGNWKDFDSSYAGSICSSGSGAEEWTEQFIKALPYFSSDNEINVKSTINKVLLNNMHFVDQDIFSPDNFKGGWGLPVDIIYAEKIFKRIEKVCYVTWQVDISLEDWSIMPQTIIKVTNQDDNLFIHNYNGIFKLYGVTSLGVKSDDMVFPDNLDFSAEIICSSVEVFFNGNLIHKLQSVYNNTDNGKIIHAELTDDNHLAMGFDTNFTNAIEASVRDFQ